MGLAQLRLYKLKCFFKHTTYEASLCWDYSAISKKYLRFNHYNICGIQLSYSISLWESFVNSLRLRKEEKGMLKLRTVGKETCMLV